jgi:hypothetical protein
LVGLGVNSRHHTCKAGALPLEAHLQSISLWFGDGDLINYLPRLALILSSEPPKQLGLQA